MKPNGITVTHLKESNIPEDYWGVDFSNYQGPVKAKDLTVTYLKQLANMKEQGIGIMYAGPPGPGKTTLAMITMKYLARANWSVYCTSLGEIVEHIQKSWKSDDKETEGFLSTCRTRDFLLIDDVGKEHRGQSGFVQTVFDNLIRHRTQHRQPTFLTTNLTPSELEGVYGEAVMSLLQGKITSVPVLGDDHRKVVQKKTTKEAFNGS